MSAPFAWISVKDELPESGLIQVLMFTPHQRPHVSLGVRSKYRGWSRSGVTHWMRVEPPKEDK